MQDANKDTLHQLSNIKANYADMAPLVTRYASEQHLQLPGTRRLTPSTSSDSVLSISTRCTAQDISVSQVTLTFDMSAAAGSRYKGVHSGKHSSKTTFLDTKKPLL